MHILSAQDSASWLKRHGARKPEVTAGRRWSAGWPEDNRARDALAPALAAIARWKSGVLIVTNTGMSRATAVEELCAYRASVTSNVAHASHIWQWPGHVLDDAEEYANKEHVRQLLGIMMSGYIEGTLATKSARFVVVVGCGVLDFYVRDKSTSGRLRGLAAYTGLEWLEG